ncbi:MAG: metallophosphoesterase N-terminal domain-containing protein, partial [Planctomycetaceae bacterium]
MLRFLHSSLRQPLTRLSRLMLIAACCGQDSLIAGSTGPEQATGIVFLDSNQNSMRDADEPGIPGVKVSNGREVVACDQNGRYQLPVDDDTILFVIKPSGYRTVIDALNIPRGYYIHKPAGSPKLDFPGVAPTGPLPASVDFPLYHSPEPAAFDVIFFGDPQPRNQQEIDFIAHDVIEELAGAQAAFGVTLGDILFDDLSLFDNFNRALSHIGVPWYNVI